MSATLIGAHVPSAGGLGGTLRKGHSQGCTAVQVFTSSPRTWHSPPINDARLLEWQEAGKDTKIGSLVSHDSYLINLADPDDARQQKSIEGLTHELNRADLLGIPFVVSHMGASLGQAPKEAMARVAVAAKRVLGQTPETVTLCMESTAGQGTSLNSSFEELAEILELCGAPERLAVCLDTCHLFAAGYDLRTRETYAETFGRFERLIGFDRLKVVHVNDSKKGFGSRVDRHDNIGKGLIGDLAFELLVKDERMATIPLILETPVEDEGHEKDLAKLWGWARQKA